MTPEQREEFDARGFVRIRGVFSRAEAAAMETRVWEWLARERGIHRDDASTWREQPSGLQDLKQQAVFAPNGGPLLIGTLDALLGAGAWQPPRHWGQLLVSFPQHGETHARGPWHTDFDFRLPADRVCGALVFSYVNDVPLGGGGTLAVAGSPRVVARFLAARRREALVPMKAVRRALLRSDPWLAALAEEENAGKIVSLPGPGAIAGQPVEVVELAGEAGDVVIGHPWLLHRTAPNRGTGPRMMRVQRIGLAVSTQAAQAARSEPTRG